MAENYTGSGGKIVTSDYLKRILTNYRLKYTPKPIGMVSYMNVHECGANAGSGVFISGKLPNLNWASKLKSTYIMGSDTCINTTNVSSTIAIGDGIMSLGNIGNHNIALGLWALHSLNIGAS
jgi:hypothetical protein